MATSSVISINQHTLTIEGSSQISGIIQMPHATSRLISKNGFTWLSQSDIVISHASAEVICEGSIEFASGSNFDMSSLGTLRIRGNTATILVNKSALTRINHLSVEKTGAGVFAISASSTSNISITGNLSNAQNSRFNNYFAGLVYLYKDFTCLNSNTAGITWEEGTLRLMGTDHNLRLSHSASHINNLTCNHAGFASQLSDFRIGGSILRSQGNYRTNNYTLRIGGDWNYILGDNSFQQGTSSVIFDGIRDSSIIPFTFHKVELSKTGSGKLLVPSGNVNFLSYKWNSGTIQVSGGNLYIHNLLDTNIKGNYILDSGNIELTQNANRYVDLDANLTINGGIMRILGGRPYPSEWAYTRAVTVNMSGGILDFGDKGVDITNTGYPLVLNISGGTIRTSGSFSISRVNTYFTGGTIELYGAADAEVYTNVAAAFYNLIIYKASAREEGTRSNTLAVNVNSSLSIDNDLTISSGYLKINNATVNVGNDVIMNQTGNIDFTSTSSVLNVNRHVSISNGAGWTATTGTINVKRDWTVSSVSNVQFSGANTVNFTGTLNSLLKVFNSNATFANMSVNKTSGQLQGHTTQNWLKLSGNLSIPANQELRLNNTIATISGSTQVNGTLRMTMATSSFTTTALTTSGSTILSDGTLSVTGTFTQQTGSVLTINGGSFNLDAPYTGAMYAFG
ncbi:MAG: hypothetical protein U1C33_07820, partial [Candidatus Cloacimonadaceae bacterium]|nr:hypothetical protein [Candidatus Cloacimonadaceae bacterium]